MDHIIKLFKSLSVPGAKEGNIFSALKIDKSGNFRVGISPDKMPSLLITSASDKSAEAVGNIILRNIAVIFDAKCSIVDNDQMEEGFFTIIKFIGDNELLINHFLRSVQVLTSSLGDVYTNEQIKKEVYKFVELFTSLSEPPTRTAQGLWAELFVIERSSDPRKLVAAWHTGPEDKFDFNAGDERIEVKSTSKDVRSHKFSIGQLNSPEGTHAVIASLFTRRSAGGISIERLILDIQPSLAGDAEMLRNFFFVINKTLGNSISESLNISFDYEVAKESLAFYEVKNIPRIMNEHIPAEVSDVFFEVNLSAVKKLGHKDIEDKTGLISIVL